MIRVFGTTDKTTTRDSDDGYIITPIEPETETE